MKAEQRLQTKSLLPLRDVTATGEAVHYLCRNKL